MTVDRDQLRSDVSRSADADTWEGTLARHCLALLDGLDRAEIREDAANARFDKASAEVMYANLRLAKVPALVEALRVFASSDFWEVTPRYQTDGRYRFKTPSESNFATPWGFAQEILAVWDGEA